jgi:hypothetical protein
MDAPPGSGEPEDTDELERLRRRAYGPDADISGDVAAQARLSDLEAVRHRHSTPADGALAEQQPAGGSVPERDLPEGQIAVSDPIDGAAAPPWWRRRRWLAILGGGIAALALNATLVAWMSQLVADGSTPIPTDTSTATALPVPDGGVQPRAQDPLAPDYVLALKSVGADADEPEDKHGTLDVLGLSTEELGRYEDFRGLSVWSGESRYGTACLLVAHPVQGLREGIGAEGCSPEGLDTIADLVHPGNVGFSSGPVFVGLPTGSLIRFVLQGEHVDVYVYVRAVDAFPSQD